MAQKTPFGLPTMSANRELTYQYYKDAVVFSPGQQITPTNLFSANNTTSKPTWMRNATFPTTTGRKVTITHIAAHMQLQLEPTSSLGTGVTTTVSQSSLLDSFASFSQLEFKVESKEYSPIPLYDLLDLRLSSAYNTTNTDQVFGDKQVRYLPLVDPILVPENGNFEIIFRPADGYSALNDTFGADSLLAYLPSATSSFNDGSTEPQTINNAGWYIQFTLFGTVSRPVK
jgi:hypothetical protein